MRKGRDMGFTWLMVSNKDSGSAGTISMSRFVQASSRFRFLPTLLLVLLRSWFLRLGHANCLGCLLLCPDDASLAIATEYTVYCYFKMTETQTTLSLSKEEGGYYNSIYALQIDCSRFFRYC